MKPIILASTSPYRKQLLDNIGLAHTAVAPKFDEETLKANGCAPQLLCETLAFRKAESLLNDFPTHYIIGSDQLVHFNGEILGKAGSAEQAIEQLLKLAGGTHELITSLAVLHQNEKKIETVVTQLTMRPLDYAQAAAFINRDKAWDCAGSYKLEKSGIMLFSDIQTKDHSAIIGLPIISLTSILIDYGIDFPFF